VKPLTRFTHTKAYLPESLAVWWARSIAQGYYNHFWISLLCGPSH